MGKMKLEREGKIWRLKGITWEIKKVQTQTQTYVHTQTKAEPELDSRLDANPDSRHVSTQTKAEPKLDSHGNTKKQLYQTSTMSC